MPLSDGRRKTQKTGEKDPGKSEWSSVQHWNLRNKDKKMN